MSKPSLWDLAVVGAGIAGSILAAELAAKGVRVLVLDAGHPRSKPCSGFLNRKLFSIYPPLKDFPDRRAFEGPRLYSSPAGHSFTISADQAVTRFDLCSRRTFDKYLLDRAVAAGARWIAQKARKISFSDHRWEITTDWGIWRAEALVGADGARSLVRKSILGSIGAEDLVMGVGRSYPGKEQTHLRSDFLKGGGIGFVLPGYGFAQIVLGYRLKGSGKLRGKLKRYVESLHGDWSGPYTSWAALQPSPISKDFFRKKIAGDNFCLIGDAAGHCDALSGEGIPFAVSGALEAAAAFLDGRLSGYEERWRDRFGAGLARSAAKVRRTPYWTRDLGAWLLSRSPSLIDVLCRGMAKGRSPTATMASAFPRFPAISWELLKG